MEERGGETRVEVREREKKGGGGEILESQWKGGGG